jgi:phenylacetic acid degradation protein
VVEPGALVGMNAVIMDGAHIGEKALVGACAFVKSGFTVPPRWVATGNPAELVRELSDEEIAWKKRGTLGYQELARRCLTSLQPARPLTEIPKDRPGVDWGGLDQEPPHARKKVRK